MKKRQNLKLYENLFFGTGAVLLWYFLTRNRSNCCCCNNDLEPKPGTTTVPTK